MDLLIFSQIVFYLSGAIAFWLVITAIIVCAIAFTALLKHIRRKTDILYRQLEYVAHVAGKINNITNFFKIFKK